MEYTDQMNRKIELASSPKRIISVVPSQTELLHDLGLDMEVIGVTKFCVHPESWFRNKTRVGGTKNLNLEKIASLNPDFILANKEENDQKQIEALKKIAPVWISDIATLEDALYMIKTVGAITKKAAQAQKISACITASFSTPLKPSHRKVLYLIWNNPYMTVGNDTFIGHMLQYCGLENCILESRYPNISKEEITALDPEFIFLSSEPFPFRQNHIDEIKKFAPNSKIMLVDGEMFSWYGSRLQKASAYFKNLMGGIPAA